MSAAIGRQRLPLTELVQALRASRGFQHKRDISAVTTVLARALPRGLRDATLAEADGILLGDDCAAIPDGDGHLLFAIEGLVEDFVAHSPWFAGYSAVMVNLSDIAAMGGRALAVVDAIWSAGPEQAEPILQGMAAASAAYGVPIVGGHSNQHAPCGQLAVAVLGRAQALLSSFHARPGQRLMMAVDLRGQWEGSAPFWNASTRAPSQRLRTDLALLPDIAEAGLCAAAKDISMAGVLGTAMMLAECSQVGARIDVSLLPHPEGHGPNDAPSDWLRWLQAFPSFGYLLAVEPEHVAEVQARFKARGIACAGIGDIVAERKVWLTQGASRPGEAEQAMLWDFTREPFIAARSTPCDVNARALESLA
jgi:AIR synthase-related protein